MCMHRREGNSYHVGRIMITYVGKEGNFTGRDIQEASKILNVFYYLTG